MAWKYEKIVNWINENKGKIFTIQDASDISGADHTYAQNFIKFCADKTNAQSIRIGNNVAYVFNADITKQITEEYLTPKRASANKKSNEKTKEDDTCNDNEHYLLPAWLTKRMMNDVWSFGLLLTTGQILGVSFIYSIKQAADGNLWADVELLPNDYKCNLSQSIIGAPTERTTASICLSHVIAAMELAYT